ncbi:MAG: RNA polymerase sigma factor [Armatimonadetes bacterium]|nr:RNA polymerase sigma factor [Armatimonadota bacterium]
MQTAEDELLVARFQAGDAEAFSRLMAIHTDQVFGLAWSVLHDREAALDATQEVFIKLYVALPRFGGAANLPAWLYRVCLNHCIDVKRRSRGVNAELTEEEWERLQGPDHEDPCRSVQNAELRDAIRRAVDGLPPRQRMAFVLRHYQFMSLKEVADVMGCTVGAIKSHLARATAHLRDSLSDYVDPAVEEVDKNVWMRQDS